MNSVQTIMLDDTAPATLARELARRATTPAERRDRYIVGIAGIPGSGKSTLARQVVEHVRSALGDARGAMIVPMDGFHLSNARLAELCLREKKGSPDTFDGAGYVEMLRRARLTDASFHFPIYDRSLHEPVLRAVDDQRIAAETRVILAEGNYLLLDIDPWRGLARVLDESWWLDTPMDTAERWIVDRHVRGGKTPEQARAHYLAVDRPNADLAIARMRRPDLVLKRTPPPGR